MDINQRKRIVLLVGAALCIIAAVVVVKLTQGDPSPAADSINTSIQRLRPRNVANDSTATPASSAANELILDIEHAMKAEDGWSGKEYGLLLNIKRLDAMRSELTPEQLQLLEYYKQQYPDWDEVDE